MKTIRLMIVVLLTLIGATSLILGVIAATKSDGWEQAIGFHLTAIAIFFLCERIDSILYDLEDK